MSKIFLAFPTYQKQIDVEIMLTACQLPNKYPEHEFAMDFIATSLITSARNYLVKRFLETDFEWLYFWDADVVIRDLTFLEKLLETADKLKADVVGGIYRLKNNDKNYAGGNRNKKGRVVNKKVGQLKTPQLIDALATGSMLIHRNVFEKFGSMWFSFVETPNGTIPEDYNFCQMAQKAGFRVAVDPRFATYHYGTAFWEHLPITKNI